MNDQRFYSLKELKDAAHEACIEAVREHRRGGIDDNVNWMGLQSNYARLWLDESGNRGYSVYVQEASPEASRLQNFVRNHLENMGFSDIEVVTEW